MIFGIDSGYPSSDPSALAANGWKFAGGYIGGSALHTWTKNDWERYVAAGFKILPWWVAPESSGTSDSGSYDGNQALGAMISVGLTGCLCLDVESEALSVEYAQGFYNSVHAGSCRVGVYGTPTTLVRLASIPWDFRYLASWPNAGTDETFAPPHCHIWQYASGPTYDYSVAPDDFKFAEL
jgi:hypothetical protein